MKLLSDIGGLTSLVLAALALVNLWSVVRFRLDVAICIWAFVSSIGLGFGLYALNLRNRIAALEKRLPEGE
jgi:hypothetical protein